MDEDDWDKPEYCFYKKQYLQSHRDHMLAALDGHGSEPTTEELEPLVGIPRDWWEDRDRIVLLDRMMLGDPPDGSLWWESHMCDLAMDLWGEDFEVPLHSAAEVEPFDEVPSRCGRRCWRLFWSIRAPGWRMLTSLSTCPNHYMRFPRYVPDSP